MTVILYLVVKYLAYSGWMFFGLQRLRNDPSPLLRSLLLGLLRLCLGFFFGVLIYLLVTGSDKTSSSISWFTFRSAGLSGESCPCS